MNSQISQNNSHPIDKKSEDRHGETKLPTKQLTVTLVI